MVLMFIWVVAKDSMLAYSLLKYLSKYQIKHLATSKKALNVLDGDKMQNFIKNKDFTHIINCSAYTDVEKAEIEKDLCYAINVKGVENLISAAKNINAKLIHYSTDYVFDGKSTFPYLETDQRSPINHYGYSKMVSEELIEQNLAKFLIIRTSWLFGYHKMNFPMKMFSLMQAKTVIDVVCDQFGRATFCDDLAVATLNLLDQNGIIHFANEGVINWYDFALAIFKDLKDKQIELKCSKINSIKSENFKTLAKRPKYSVLNTKKYERVKRQSIRSYKDCLEEFFLQSNDIY
jgi:dTDP-4-dehydrorhamnose reductase